MTSCFTASHLGLEQGFHSCQEEWELVRMSFSSRSDPIIVTGGQGISCSTMPGFKCWYGAVIGYRGTFK